MREKKFRGFDDIHCPQSWKEQVMDQAESSERKKSVYIWRIAVLFLLALLSLGTAYACSDTVRDWLSSLFSNGQEKAQVKEDPVSVQALNGITYLDADCRYYVKLPEEKIAGEDTLTVYEKGRIVEDAVPKKSIELQLPVENSTVTVQLQYVHLKNEYLPLYLEGEEGTGIPDSSFRVLADGMLVIEYMQDTFQNAYLVNPETADVQSIGDLSYHAEAESGMHIYANTVQSSASGRFLLYRTYALAQGWAKEKTEAQWVLLDRVENTRRRLDTKRLLAICWEMSCVWLAIRTSLQQKAMQWMLRPKRIIRLCIITVRIPGQSTVTTSALFPLSVIICIVQETLPWSC